MKKDIKFFLILGMALIGVIFIELVFLLEHVIPDSYTGIILIVGFVLVVMSLIFMKKCR